MDSRHILREPVTDRIHGVVITDEYRWLEDGESALVRAFEEAENQETRAYLDGPDNARWREQWLRWAALPTYRTPRIVGPFVYFVASDGVRPQPRLMRVPRTGGDPTLIVDPLEEGSDGLSALDWWSPSPSGRYVAYGISRSGDEKSTLCVRDMDRGGKLDEAIPGTRYASLAWDADEGGFFYGRYPLPGELHAEDPNYHQHLFHHRLGLPHTDDPDLLGEGFERRHHFIPQLSPDGRFLVVTVTFLWTSSSVYLAPADAPERLVRWAGGVEAQFYPELGPDGVYLHSDWQAPMRRVLYHDWPSSTDIPELSLAAWEERVAADPRRPLVDMAVAANGLLLHYMEDAASALEWDAGGTRTPVAVPGLGSLQSLSADARAPGAVVEFDSFVSPPGVYAVAPEGSMLRLFGADADLSSQVVVERDWYESTDQTRIPLFVVSPREAAPGPRPTILTGYGGFAISSTPHFRSDLAAFVERGGVFALAVLRGGGEYGEAWHRAGMREHKQQVFDDCAAAARHLIATGRTDSRHLAVSGGSNGGLLTGAMLTQHPDLFGAVVIGVPLLDMIRFHRFLIADLWTGEYGSPEDPEAFRWLYAYSPYHRVVEHTAYPAVFLYAARSDSRVDPMHARKMLARLKASTSSSRPILLRMEADAGHGVGKPLWAQADAAADILTFVNRETGGEL
ncbi:MAG: prolyl oligopeptidase family serine peptidase [Firmicutes bacterium]|jgi:prolyl oligopeptidase|nr:prolyl oligopeptidase family serine peptidase [Bacillota bacterium]